MENASFEQALEVVKVLPAVDKRRLQQWLTEDEHTQFNASANGEMKLAYPRAREMGSPGAARGGICRAVAGVGRRPVGELWHRPAPSLRRGAGSRRPVYGFR